MTRGGSRPPLAAGAILGLVVAFVLAFQLVGEGTASPAPGPPMPEPSAAVAIAAVVVEPTRTAAPEMAEPSATMISRATPSPTTAPTTAPTPEPLPTSTPTPTATPGPTSAPVLVREVKPTPQPTPALDPPATDGPFRMDLYEKGDFVSQMDKNACVPAAMQTMINIMSPGADRSKKTQKALLKLARDLSSKGFKGKGAEPEGWAAALTELGYGSYVVSVHANRTAAIAAAAQALRLTGRPVGILAWRGAHSWVMSGFRATADPAVTDAFMVTHVNIQDVWFPRISSIWGASRPPGSLVPIGRLAEDILAWRRPDKRHPDKDGRYVLILPVAPKRA